MHQQDTASGIEKPVFYQQSTCTDLYKTLKFKPRFSGFVEMTINQHTCIYYPAVVLEQRSKKHAFSSTEVRY